MLNSGERDVSAANDLCTFQPKMDSVQPKKGDDRIEAAACDLRFTQR
jgi:hypothetical protein